MSSSRIEGVIEVIGIDLMCFKVDARTLNPISTSYYEPAAWSDPRGPQMGINEWHHRRAVQRENLWQSPYAPLKDSHDL